VYPSLERLAALGYLSTAFLGIRPWTRMECARLLEEMDEEMDTDTDTNTNTNKDDRMGYQNDGPVERRKRSMPLCRLSSETRPPA